MNSAGESSERNRDPMRKAMRPTMSTVCNGNIGTVGGTIVDVEVVDGSLRPPGTFGSVRRSDTL